MLKDSTVGRMGDSTTRVFKTKTSYSSCRNSIPISNRSAWKIDGKIVPVFFFLLLLNMILPVAKEEKVQEDNSA